MAHTATTEPRSALTVPSRAAEEPAAAQPSAGATYDAAEHEDARLGPYAKAAAQAQAPPSTAPSAAPPNASQPPAPAADKTPDAIIADYLLNGWTMLGEACPIAECYSPLMWQKKERKKFCPVHQLYVMTGAHALRAGSRCVALTRRWPAADAEAAAKEPQSEAAATEAQESGAAPAAAPVAPQAAPRARHAGVAQTVAASEAVLLDRIARVTAELEAATSAAAAHELVALITSCATAIKALREL